MGEKASVADVTEAMRDVVDPEIGINIVDLGLVYGVTVDDANVATLDMTLTSAACPLTDVIEDQTRAALKDLPAARPGRGPLRRGRQHKPVEELSEQSYTRKPRARICSRPSSVIASTDHGGIQTQLMR